MITNQKPANRRNPIRFLLRIPVPWVFVLTYLAGAALELTLPFCTGLAPTFTLRLVGASLLVFGAAVAAWSLLLFHKARTTTVPGKLSSELVTRGPYRFCRNPMYVSLIVAYLGEAGILKQLWPVLLLPLTVAYLNWIVIPLEEARLTKVFGEHYQQCRARVRRWL
jgi:protein-S-isoprenylcysteine O-methyltransferase Ste14